METSSFNKRLDTAQPDDRDVYFELPNDLRKKVFDALDEKEAAEASGDLALLRAALGTLSKALASVREHNRAREVVKAFASSPRLLIKQSGGLR